MMRRYMSHSSDEHRAGLRAKYQAMREPKSKVKTFQQDTAWMGQPHMVKKIIKEFREEVAKLTKYTTPGSNSQEAIKSIISLG